MEHLNDLYKDWLGAFQAIGIPAISRDTSARILAVVYIYGNNEAMVYCKKFTNEIEHIKAMYHIDGGETPDAEIVPLIQQYVKELEQSKEIPEWAHKLFGERFGIKLIS